MPRETRRKLQNGWTVALFATDREDLFDELSSTLGLMDIFERLSSLVTWKREHVENVRGENAGGGKNTEIGENAGERAKKIGLEEVCMRCLSDGTLERIHVPFFIGDAGMTSTC
ncbi:alpha/beta-Hydrolases superfamily protein [Striga asiatica]|uniref:Alpha/beta-Hydrolases superfamily protein n=1 Tax=Striga asiatica TaxID=4170 RepID=A0A5A7Q144_STRAF|nr:alpha/beta-Hydrolases superfamily protein [Striga asiatica]